ncbi:hypothetical protein AHiyo4_33790 [Arthrobacter sp. Hiyo4]|nr:hypothetical protein AHiyo4_33790 [Arthrobacter sp. Hiyo4]
MSAKFKAETGADIQWETFASANDEMTRIQTSVVSARAQTSTGSAPRSPHGLLHRGVRETG